MEDLNDHNEGTEVDPAAEFLAREQNELAGLEDELKPATVAPTNGMQCVISFSTSVYTNAPPFMFNGSRVSNGNFIIRTSCEYPVVFSKPRAVILLGVE